MSVNPLGATTSNGLNPYPTSNGLTGDAMMIYLSTQLSDMDGDIQGFMDEQAAVMRKKEVYQMYRSCIANRQEDWRTADANYTEYTESLPPGSPEQKLAMELRAQFSADHQKDGKFHVTDKQYDAALVDIDNAIAGLSKDGELKMIRLQQLMTQRQTAVQLATNMMSKFGEGINAIVGNIR